MYSKNFVGIHNYSLYINYGKTSKQEFSVLIVANPSYENLVKLSLSV